MANPQAENGHTDIANEILEALARVLLSPDEWRVLMVVFRKTWGWHKREDWISLSQFVLMTGMKKPNVCRALGKLIARNIVIRIDNGNGKSYRFQKDFESWEPLSKQITLSKPITPVIQIDNDSLSKQIPTKEKQQKKLLQKSEASASFEVFYKSYPKKKARRDAENAWKKLNPDLSLIALIMASLEKQKASQDWKKDGGQYIPLPASWLNGRRWEDEIPEAKAQW